MIELRQAALEILALTNPHIKVERAHQLFYGYHSGLVGIDTSADLNSDNLNLPGRPDRPRCRARVRTGRWKHPPVAARRS